MVRYFTATYIEVCPDAVVLDMLPSSHGRKVEAASHFSHLRFQCRLAR